MKNTFSTLDLDFYVGEGAHSQFVEYVADLAGYSLVFRRGIEEAELLRTALGDELDAANIVSPLQEAHIQFTKTLWPNILKALAGFNQQVTDMALIENDILGGLAAIKSSLSTEWITMVLQSILEKQESPKDQIQALKEQFTGFQSQISSLNGAISIAYQSKLEQERQNGTTEDLIAEVAQKIEADYEKLEEYYVGITINLINSTFIGLFRDNKMILFQTNNPFDIMVTNLICDQNRSDAYSETLFTLLLKDRGILKVENASDALIQYKRLQFLMQELVGYLKKLLNALEQLEKAWLTIQSYTNDALEKIADVDEETIRKLTDHFSRMRVEDLISTFLFQVQKTWKRMGPYLENPSSRLHATITFPLATIHKASLEEALQAIF